MKRESLLKRLDAIGASLSSNKNALALLGLGSVGKELDRLDDYSDLDFFVITRAGSKQRFIDDLSWLSAVSPIAYCFKNTVDGYKLLFEDGIFCEMAVFEAAELASIPFAEGRIVWQAQDFNTDLCKSKVIARINRPVEWIIGEALTNLYVGLCRFHRGERLSAQRFIEHYAVDRVVELAATIAQAGSAHVDPFNTDRRFEQRYPDIAQELPAFIQGYNNSPASARAILNFLDKHFEINAAMKGRILALCGPE